VFVDDPFTVRAARSYAPCEPGKMAVPILTTPPIVGGWILATDVSENDIPESRIVH
jgi:hypothetical protein